jgi:hypothetical protein
MGEEKEKDLSFFFFLRRRPRRKESEEEKEQRKNEGKREQKSAYKFNGFTSFAHSFFPPPLSTLRPRAMPPRRRPWPALQIDVGGEEPGGGGFALAENAKAKRNVDAARSHRASTSTSASSTSSSIRASYAEAARRSTTNINYNNRSSVCASAMLSFCDDGRLKPSAFGAAIRAGRETRPSEFSVSAVATTEAGGGGGGGIAAQAPAPPPPQQQQTSSARVRDDGVTGREPEAAAVAAAWHQVRRHGFERKKKRNSTPASSFSLSLSSSQTRPRPREPPLPHTHSLSQKILILSPAHRK